MILLAVLGALGILVLLILFVWLLNRNQAYYEHLGRKAVGDFKETVGDFKKKRKGGKHGNKG